MMSILPWEWDNNRAVRQLLDGLDPETEVWKDDTGEVLIGDASEFDEDDADNFRLIGTVGSILAAMEQPQP